MNFDHQQDNTEGLLKTIIAILGTVLIAGAIITLALLSAGCGITLGIDPSGNVEITIPYETFK
ncbi:MAG: hypothetical protein H7A48_14555 [Akkermansiaceae bacterium]|nr:hypothetical protein [Akkermansiaceae bacterium]